MRCWVQYNENCVWIKMFQKLLILICFLWLGSVSGTRVQRHLVFTEGSRLFFSVDVRDNLFDYSKFFAHVFGVKMDWHLPSTVIEGKKKGRIQRRDLYQGMEHILRRQNVNETSCIRKFVCEASVILPQSNEFLAQLYEVIFSASDKEIRNAYKMADSKEHCVDMLNLKGESECPLSLTTIFSESQSSFNILTN